MKKTDVMVWECSALNDLNTATLFIRKFILNGTVCFFALGLIKILSMISVKGFKKIGRETLGIYMVQTFVFENFSGKFVISNSWSLVGKSFAVIIISVFILSVSYGIVKMLRTRSITNKILLGAFEFK